MLRQAAGAAWMGHGQNSASTRILRRNGPWQIDRLTASCTDRARDEEAEWWIAAYDDTPSEVSATIIEHLLHLIAKISPGARKGATAPYTFADFILTEIGTRQPRSLATAFRTPSKPTLEDALRRLSMRIDEFDDAYGPHEQRSYLTTAEGFNPQISPAKRLKIDSLTSQAANFLAT